MQVYFFQIPQAPLQAENIYTTKFGINPCTPNMEMNNIQKVPSNHMIFQLSLLYLHIETFFFPWIILLLLILFSSISQKKIK